MYYLQYKDIKIGPEQLVDQFQETSPFVQRSELRGEIRLILRDSATLQEIHDTGWMPNLVTDAGIVNLGASGAFDYAHIGTGLTAPATTDTSVEGWLGQGGTTVSGSTSSATPNLANGYIGWYQNAKRITGGSGTINQIGFNQFNTNVDMTIKTLVTTPLAKASNQTVDVYHKLYCTWDSNRKTGVVSIDGEDYNFVTSFGYLQKADYTRYAIRPDWTNAGYYYSHVQINPAVNLEDWNLTGDGTGSGTNQFSDAPILSSQTISPGIRQANAVLNVPIEDCNTVGAAGIKGIAVLLAALDSSKPRLFIQLNRVSDGAGVFKTNKQSLQFTCHTQWGRVGTVI